MNSISGYILKSILLLKPLPDKFFCEECKYLLDIADPELVAWATEHRDDLLDGGTGLVNVELRCRCLTAKEKEDKRIKLMWASANLPRRDDSRGPRTILNFRAVEGTFEMITAIEEFVRGGDPSILVLLGAVGGGKTHLAEHVLRAALNNGKPARYERAEEMLERLRHTYNSREDGDITDILAWYRAFHVLVIDDLGAQDVKEWGAGYMTRIVDERYADAGRLLVISNFVEREEIAPKWGERLCSRLFDDATGTVKQVLVEAEDYRQKKSRPRGSQGAENG